MSDTEEGVPWRNFFVEARRVLAREGWEVESAEIEARRIVEEAAGLEPSEFYLGLNQPATVRGVTHFDAMVARRLKGEPLQYVLGRWGFRQLDLTVDKRVLIPRPETEIVTEFGLRELHRQAQPDRELLAVDLGTGSGAIGLSLAVERTDVRVICTDASPGAVAVARANLAGIGRPATRVQILEGSWFAALPAEAINSCHLVISNPPYVATGDELPPEVREWEPHCALFAGEDGLDDVRILVPGALEWLADDGSLVMELAERQLDEAASLADDLGYSSVEVQRDLTGRERVLICRK